MRNVIPDSVPASSWRSARLFVTDEFAAPPVILRVDDSVIGTLGNFSASTGKAKSKKTFNVCAIVAAAMMGGTVLNYSASLPPRGGASSTSIRSRAASIASGCCAGFCGWRDCPSIRIRRCWSSCACAASHQRAAAEDRGGDLRPRRPRIGRHRRHPPIWRTTSTARARRPTSLRS